MVTLRVTTHSGGEDIVEVETYDPITLNEQMNDYNVHSIVIGNNVYSRIDLKNIKPIETSKE